MKKTRVLATAVDCFWIAMLLKSYFQHSEKSDKSFCLWMICSFLLNLPEIWR